MKCNRCGKKEIFHNSTINFVDIIIAAVCVKCHKEEFICGDCSHKSFFCGNYMTHCDSCLRDVKIDKIIDYV